LVDLVRFELTTSSMPWKRAPNCATGPVPLHRIYHGAPRLTRRSPACLQWYDASQARARASSTDLPVGAGLLRPASCAGASSPARAPMPRRSCSQRINRPSSTASRASTRPSRSFSATVDMVPALGSSEKSKITEYKDVRGYILFRKPADIRIIGLYPVVRNKAFDMVSNGKDFRLYLPGQQPLRRRLEPTHRPLPEQDRKPPPAAFSGSPAGGAHAAGRKSGTRESSPMKTTPSTSCTSCACSRTERSCPRAASGSAASTCTWPGSWSTIRRATS
jgi:hypothetical protein